jgi:uncharacterized membrane protein YbhN (UPF0104 family)
VGLPKLVRRFGPRAVGLVVTAAGLYLVAPSLLALFDAWPSLGDVRPVWFGVIGGLEVASFASLWLLLRIALPGSRWRDIAASQLAGNAATRIIPGGAASGGVVQARMLIRSGQPPGAVGTALGAAGLLSTAVLLALPVLTIPAVIIGPPLSQRLQLGLVVSLVLAVVMVAVGLALLRWDRLVGAVARAIGRVAHGVRRRLDPAVVAGALVAERNQIAAAFQGRWAKALAGAAGNRVLDYSALVAALVAVGAEARPSLVLVAYVGALALGMIPITPGGLGFVEAGLTTLLVLAGVDADQAVVGTLLYRLVSFWLPIPAGALAWGAWRVGAERS